MQDAEIHTGLPNGLPPHRDLYYDGGWHAPIKGGRLELVNPANGMSLGQCANAGSEDIDLAVTAASRAFLDWKQTKSTERAALLRKIAGVIRENSEELAILDSLNGGNPIADMRRDIVSGANYIDLFAGLVTELKGTTIPLGDGMIHMTVREPYGVVARIVAFNHPLLFATRFAPPLLAGNTVIIKPPHQAPLSTFRLMQLIDGILPPGVLNIVTADRVGSEALVSHPDVPRITLIGSPQTGRAIARAGADRLKRMTLELGGKNAFIIYPDADLEKAARAAVDGMNFSWCGQSCGSTSRLFLHEKVYESVLPRILDRVAHYIPGDPIDEATTMGSLISAEQLRKVEQYVEIATGEGATLLCGGRRPNDSRLADGFFFEPTIFTDVTQNMRIATEEVFGPILSIIRWNDEDRMISEVNGVEYGLTASVWTNNLSTAHVAASRIQSGYIWINAVSSHYSGVPFGGYKQSGLGRDEGIEEITSFTQEKSVNIML